MRAMLPMYDLPHLRKAHNALWYEVYLSCKNEGIPAPKRLSYPTYLDTAWRDKDLFLAQTCGLPYATQLRDHVSLIGAPIYDVPHCGQGTYASVIIAPLHSPCQSLADFQRLKSPRIALNGFRSQSGFAALMHDWLDAELPVPPHGNFQVVGSHMAAIRTVANNNADIAAIDCVTWALAKQVEPLCAHTRVIGITEQMPGLPLITAQNRYVAELTEIISDVFRVQNSNKENTLKIKGLKRFSDSDYDVIGARYERIMREFETRSDNIDT